MTDDDRKIFAAMVQTLRRDRSAEYRREPSIDRDRLALRRRLAYGMRMDNFRTSDGAGKCRGLAVSEEGKSDSNLSEIDDHHVLT
jgi:hypothetical protein